MLVQIFFSIMIIIKKTYVAEFQRRVIFEEYVIKNVRKQLGNSYINTRQFAGTILIF